LSRAPRPHHRTGAPSARKMRDASTRHVLNPCTSAAEDLHDRVHPPPSSSAHSRAPQLLRLLKASRPKPRPRHGYPSRARREHIHLCNRALTSIHAPQSGDKHDENALVPPSHTQSSEQAVPSYLGIEQQTPYPSLRLCVRRQRDRAKTRQSWQGHFQAKAGLWKCEDPTSALI